MGKNNWIHLVEFFMDVKMMVIKASHIEKMLIKHIILKMTF